MAVNTQKLLPAAKTTSALARANVGKIFSSSLIKSKKIDTKKFVGSLAKRDEPGAIVNTLTDIDTRLKLILGEEQRQQSKKKKEKEKAEFQKAEEKLEAPKEAKKFKLPGLAVPGMSFLDRIKRFLFFTALGWLFTKFQDQLPKLEGILKTITQVYGIAENIFKFLLESFVNLIDRGYQTYDKVRDLAKNIGGEKAQQDFDKLSGKLNEYINYVLIGGMALTGAINSFNKAAGRSSAQVAKEAAKKTTGEVAKRAATKGILQKTAQVSTTRATKAVVGKQATRQLLRLAKGPLSRLPVIGALVEFGLSWALGDPVGKAAFRGVGTLLLGAVGSLILPGFGTFAGGIIGAELAGKLYELLFENKQQKGKVQKKQSGGPVTRGGKSQGNPRRTIRVARRKPPKVKPQSSQPGKDVGGKKKIKELYPDPSARVDIEGPQKGPWWNLLSTDLTKRDEQLKTLPNSYKALTSIAKILKDIPFGIGALMGGAVDIALGQKLPKNAIDGLSNGISYLVNSLANQQAAKSISSIQKEIATLQTGGVTPKLRDLTKNENNEFGSGINKVLTNLIQQKVDEAIREVQKQLMPGKYGESKKEVLPGDIDTTPGNIRVTSESPDFWLLVTAALFENGNSADGYQGAADAAQAIYNRVSLPGWPKSIRGVILQPGQFQPVNDYGGVSEWSQINSKEKAIAFAKKYKGYGGNIVEKIAASLLDRSKQENARTFVGPRDNFRSDSYEKSNDHLDDSTEKSRYGHTFGFEPRGANIGKFKKGQLMPAEVNKEVVKGDIIETGSGYGSEGSKISGELGRYIKSKLRQGPDFQAVTEHPEFGGVKGTHAKNSYHYSGRAIDIGAYANEQGPILKVIAEFNKLKGLKPVELLHAGNDSGHQDHVHVAYQGGGYIPRQSPRRDTQRLSSYPSYSAEGGMLIAIQPMIIEKAVPMPSGKNRTIMFPIPVGVNNSSMQSLSRG